MTSSMQTPPSRRRALRGLLVPLLPLLLAAALPALAHGPTRQKVSEKITIEAPADAVWAKVKNFDALKDWHPAVAASPADKGNAEGSVRTLKLKDGGALPVSNYTSTIQVTGTGATSTVEWRGAFYRAYPNNNPPPEQNDEAALKAVTDVYRGGLAHLKKMMESK